MIFTHIHGYSISSAEKKKNKIKKNHTHDIACLCIKYCQKSHDLSYFVDNQQQYH